VKPLCDGLDAAHAAGLAHGRVSPREIVVDADAWKLSGLGLPGVPPADAAPPEGDVPSKEGDLYGLAISLYEALSGEKPFHGAEGPLAKREGRPASLAGRVGLPQGLDALFSRALAADPSRRFHAASELYLALRTIVSPGVH
jgi:serine/threonine-protein kinase